MSEVREPMANGDDTVSERQYVDIAAPADPPEVPECHGEVCVTCSDQAVPVTVIRLLGDDLALVDTGVTREEVSVAFVDAAAGDTLLVHAKEAIGRVRET